MERVAIGFSKDDISHAHDRVLAAARDARRHAMAETERVAREIGDWPVVAVGVGNHVYDRLRGHEWPRLLLAVVANLLFVGGFVALVAALAGGWLPTEPMLDGAAQSWQAGLALSLLGGGIVVSLGVLANLVARDLLFRARKGYSRYFADRMMRHAGRLVAVGDKAVYLRNLHGDTRVIRLDLIGHVMRIHEGSFRNLAVIGRDGTVLAHTYDLRVADADTVVEAILARIPPDLVSAEKLAAAVG